MRRNFFEHKQFKIQTPTKILILSF